MGHLLAGGCLIPRSDCMLPKTLSGGQAGEQEHFEEQLFVRLRMRCSWPESAERALSLRITAAGAIAQVDAQ